jgi:hypothetical protein
VTTFFPLGTDLPPKRSAARTGCRFTRRRGQQGEAAPVLISQNRAISIARDGTTGRVLALELLAAQVAVAEAARRDWGTAHLMAANNDKFLDLVARTAADQHATVEITDLADATQEVREALQRATQAAEALALPESR